MASPGNLALPPANIYPWPLHPASGVHNTSHTSPLAVFYSYQSIPTPWPFLVGGFLLSLTLTVSSAIINEKTPTGKPSNPYYVSAIQSVNLIRCLTTFVAGAKAVAGGAGRFFSFSQVATLLLSVLPPVLDIKIWAAWRILAGLNILLTLIMVAMMTSVSTAFTHHYGAWYALGDTCPRVVPSCRRPFLKPYREWTGCFDPRTSPAYISAISDVTHGAVNYTAYETPPFIRANQVALAETSLGLAAWGFAIFFGASILGRLWRGGHAAARIKERMVSQRLLWVTYIVSVVAICCLAGFAIPLHYTQQVTVPRRISIVDGFGPLLYMGYLSENSSLDSWVDCFEVMSPTDPSGFWDIWIADRKRNAVALLPFL